MISINYVLILQIGESGVHCPSDLLVSSGENPPRVWVRRVVWGTAAAAAILLSFSLLAPLKPHTPSLVTLDCN